MSEHYLKLLPGIRVLAFDVDGVMTDGSIILTPEGDPLRSVNTKDSYALKQAHKAGLHLAAITRSRSTILRDRLKQLGFDDVKIDITDKLDAYEELKYSYAWKDEQVLYIGDDVPDIPVLREVGVPCCPADAVHEVRDICRYISPFDGGRGCVRDIVEKVLRSQHKWPSA